MRRVTELMAQPCSPRLSHVATLGGRALRGRGHRSGRCAGCHWTRRPDTRVAGGGVAGLEEAGIAVETGVGRLEIEDQLRPYLHHRRTGRPFIVLKMASTLDGRTAAPDGTSQWITGPEARVAVHKLRAHSDAICVGAGTVRLDDPSLRVRDWQPDRGDGVRPAGSDANRARLGPASSQGAPLSRGQRETP